MINAIASILGAVVSIKNSIIAALNSPDSGTAEAVLNQTNQAIQDATTFTTSLDTLFPTWFSTTTQNGVTVGANTGLTNTLGILGIIGQVKTFIENVSMQNTANAVELYNEINENLISAENDYDQSIVKAHQKLNIYLACIQDANGDGECDGPFGPGPGGPGGPGPGPGPSPPPPPPNPDDPPDPYDPDLVQSFDPNDIIGPEGFGTEQWVAGTASLPYMIRFENQADATAPAARVSDYAAT